MIKEYHFAALRYDESEKTVHCARCGDAVAEGRLLFKSSGRWVCGKCAPKMEEAPTESSLCATAKAAAEG